MERRIMAKNRIIHARLDEDTHEKLFEKCNELGCTFTDYVESVIAESLEDEPDEEPSEIEPKRAKVTKWKLYDDDGNLVSQSSENS